jgi:hypothetical protein
VNGRRGGEDLAVLIERSAELKRDLVDFACSPRMERSLAAAMAEAGPEEFEEADAISTIDRFTLQYRLPDGQTVVDRFVASRPDLTVADREMLLSWRDPVEGIFEIRGQDGDAIILLNLLDDLEYRTYSNMGRAAFRSLPRDGFVHARLVPIGPVPWICAASRPSRARERSTCATKWCYLRPGRWERSCSREQSHYLLLVPVHRARSSSMRRFASSSGISMNSFCRSPRSAETSDALFFQTRFRVNASSRRPPASV